MPISTLDRLRKSAGDGAKGTGSIVSLGFQWWRWLCAGEGVVWPKLFEPRWEANCVRRSGLWKEGECICGVDDVIHFVIHLSTCAEDIDGQFHW